MIKGGGKRVGTEDSIIEEDGEKEQRTDDDKERSMDQGIGGVWLSGEDRRCVEWQSATVSRRG